MRNKHKLSAVVLLGLSLTSGAFAANVSLHGTIPDVVQLKQVDSFSGSSANQAEKDVTFQRVVLSAEAKQYLAQQVDAAVKPARLNAALQSLPSASSIDMNGVPVLDQGRHGTCVTFAVLGALDATIGETSSKAEHGHFSELCNLELGSTLESQSPVNDKGEHIYPSGWDGSWATIVLDQIKTYGLVTHKDQKHFVCAGVKKYPLSVERDHGKAMETADFDAHSEKVATLPTYKIIMHSDDAFSSRVDMNKVLEEVKSVIARGHRATFGTLLDVKQGHNGALGSYKTPFDTWILTSRIAQNAKDGTIEAGHEMIILGYDDNAVVTGPDNEKHQGVLTLRNSWGVRAGNHGIYYMTYDHFKTLALEAVEFIPAK